MGGLRIRRTDCRYRLPFSHLKLLGAVRVNTASDGMFIVPKSLVSGLVLVLLGAWIIHSITRFAIEIIDLVPQLGLAHFLPLLADEISIWIASCLLLLLIVLSF